VSGYEYRTGAQIGNERRNVGAFSGERLMDKGDERDRGLDRAIAGFQYLRGLNREFLILFPVGQREQWRFGDSSVIAQPSKGDDAILVRDVCHRATMKAHRLGNQWR
jgi:hypothetical protein